MTMRSRWLLVVIVGVVGLVAGLSLALGHPSKYGPDHSCPAGASRSACRYPPSLGLQRTEWSAIGLVVGLILAAAIIFAVSRRTESAGAGTAPSRPTAVIGRARLCRRARSRERATCRGDGRLSGDE